MQTILSITQEQKESIIRDIEKVVTPHGFRCNISQNCQSIAEIVYSRLTMLVGAQEVDERTIIKIGVVVTIAYREVATVDLSPQNGAKYMAGAIEHYIFHGASL